MQTTSKVSSFSWNQQCAKKVVPDSPGLVDFAIGLVNSVFNLPNGQVMFYEEFNNRRTVKSILLVKTFLGLVEMMSGLVNASFSLPKWQAVKMIFFAPWTKFHTFLKWSISTLTDYQSRLSNLIWVLPTGVEPYWPKTVNKTVETVLYIF